MIFVKYPFSERKMEYSTFNRLFNYAMFLKFLLLSSENESIVLETMCFILITIILVIGLLFLKELIKEAICLFKEIYIKELSSSGNILFVITAGLKAAVTTGSKYGVPILKTSAKVFGGTLGTIACVNNIYKEAFDVSLLKTAGKVYTGELSSKEGFQLINDARCKPKDS